MLLVYAALIGRIVAIGFEKILVKKLSNFNSSVVSFWWFFLNIFMYLPVLFFVEIQDFTFIYCSLAAGVFYAFAFALFAKSMKYGEVSLIGPLYNFNILFILILAVIFLGEPFTIFKLLGILLLIYGASWLSGESNFFKSYKSLLTSRGPLFMLLCSLLVAGGRIIDGFTMKHAVNPVVFALFSDLFTSAYLFFYLAAAGKSGELGKILKEKPWHVIALSLCNFSYLLLLIAFQYMDVSVVEPITMLSAIVTVVLAKFIFKERIASRIFAVLIMWAGVFLLFQ